MADATVATAPENAVSTGASQKGSAKKGKTAAAATKKKPATHPRTSDMVNAAIKSLKERGGSSLQAIKKYVSANYKVDADKLSPFIKKYIKSAVASGALVQTKGKGASGSFKLATTAGATTAKKPATGKKGKGGAVKTAKRKSADASAAATKTKASAKSPVKKAAATPTKKGAVSRVAKRAPAGAVAEKKAPAVAKAKSPSKAKKTTKVPTKKPKAPKSIKKSTKKVAAKKK